MPGGDPGVEGADDGSVASRRNNAGGKFCHPVVLTKAACGPIQERLNGSSRLTDLGDCPGHTLGE
jgi:hypothetical protein